MEFLQIWDIILRRKWIIITIFILFFAVISLGTNFITPSYEAKTLVLVEGSDSVDSLMKGLGLDTVSVGMSSSTGEEYETEIALATVRPLLAKLISQLYLKDRNGEIMKPDGLTAGSMKKRVLPEPHVEVEQYEDADILEIIARSPSASEAAIISNKLAELYIEDTLDRTREEFKAARIFIEAELKQIKDEYYKSLAEIKDFMIKEKAINLSSEIQQLIEKIGNLKTNNEDNEKEILTLERTQNVIKNQLKERKEFRKESEVFGKNDELIQLKSKLNDRLISISGKAGELRKTHPDYKQLEKEIEVARGLIKQETAVVFDNKRIAINPIYDDLSEKLVENHIDYTAAIAKRKLYQTYIDAYQNELLNIPIKYIENQKLEMELSVKRNAYENLLEYMLNVEVAESMTMSDIILIEPAEAPDKQDFPNKILNYILSIILGLFWGILSAFFREYIDNTIKNPGDLKSFKNLTNLGSIPETKEFMKERVISKLEATSLVAESIRTVRNSILYASVDKPLKTISITSSIDSEGKSSLAANIAILFSMEGRKVILTGADLRKPSLHRFFNIPDKKGLTNILFRIDATGRGYSTF